MPPQAESTQDDVWDDSALVSSWNGAYKEYKKYHSIAARGEKVSPNDLNASAGTAGASDMDGRAKQPNFTTLSTPPIVTASASGEPYQEAPDHHELRVIPEVKQKNSFGPPTWPQQLINSSQSEDMQNLMMSWYYAGYYTGFYDGQQKAGASMQERE